MPKITLKKLKAASFNAVSLVEETVDIDTRHLKKSLSGTQELISEIDTLREALFFKDEKLKREEMLQENRRCIQKVEKLKNKLKGVSLPQLEDTSILLEKNKEILELKEVQKCVRYFSEIQKSGDQVLKTLENSEIKEDWIFLGKLLYYAIKFWGEADKKKVFLDHSKRLEGKLLGRFRKHIEEGGIAECNAAFNALKVLEKENILLDEYMLRLGLLEISLDDEDIKTKEKIIDLDSHIPEYNPFSNFIQHISDILGDKMPEFNMIFGTDKKYSSYFYDSLFRMVIFRGVDRFLAVSSPALFLSRLSTSYKLVESYGKFISLHYNDFPLENYLSEGFRGYIQMGIDKEKELFDDIFGCYMGLSEPQVKYVIMGEYAKKSVDYCYVYERVLYIVDACEGRGRVFYTSEMMKELLTYFYRKATLIIERIIGEGEQDMKILMNMTTIYLLTKRYFKDRIHLLRDFCFKLSKASRDAFDGSIALALSRVDDYVKKLNFQSSDQHVTLLDYIKDALKAAEPLKGKNYETYLLKVLFGVYNSLHTQVLSTVYQQKQKEHLIKCVNDFLGYVVITGAVDAVKKFYHLKEICELICVSSENFIITYEEFKNSISENELSRLIKCRKDKNKIRDLLAKVSL